MTVDTVSPSLQALLERAIASGAAPGLTACAFTRHGTFATAVAGVASVETGAPMTTDTTLWLGSAGKTVVSLAALALVEKEGFVLDSHEELVKVVPELGKDWPGTKIWSIFDGKDDKGGYKLKPASVGITLRHLLTHTSGFSAGFTSDEMMWFRETAPQVLGEIKGYNTPRLFEAGQGYNYGSSPGYVGLFIIRKSGKTLRRALQDLVLGPLGCEPDTIDAFLTPKMKTTLATIAMRNSEGDSFTPLPFSWDMPQWKDEPPEGFMHVADAPLYGKLDAFARVLRAFLNNTAPTAGGEPILSPAMWKQATEDDLKLQGLSTPEKPFFYSAVQWAARTVDQWCELKDPNAKSGLGWNLMQTLVHRDEANSGLKPGTLEWSGAVNTYFFVDPATGVGAVLSAHFFPFADPAMLEVRDEFFKWVYEHAPKDE
ncbi:hypothetical protein JCM10207_004577 [Rhodosporidiobolus poonsookiae]